MISSIGNQGVTFDKGRKMGGSISTGEKGDIDGMYI